MWVSSAYILGWHEYLFTDFAGELCNHLSDEERHNADAATAD